MRDQYIDSTPTYMYVMGKVYSPLKWSSSSCKLLFCSERYFTSAFNSVLSITPANESVHTKVIMTVLHVLIFCVVGVSPGFCEMKSWLNNQYLFLAGESCQLACHTHLVTDPALPPASHTLVAVASLQLSIQLL